MKTVIKKEPIKPFLRVYILTAELRKNFWKRKNSSVPKWKKNFTTPLMPPASPSSVMTQPNGSAMVTMVRAYASPSTKNYWRK